MRMKKQATFYRNHDGVEIDEDEAFDNGILKDGIVVSVSKMMRDSLASLQRAVAADADRRVTDAFGGQAGHRPGYAFATSDQAAQDTKARAYADHDRYLANAWRGDAGQNGGQNVSDDRPGYKIAADGLLVGAAHDGPRLRTQSRFEAVSANDASRDHSRVMQNVYGVYDAELAQRWRLG
jgi:hypothetical protein